MNTLLRAQSRCLTLMLLALLGVLFAPAVLAQVAITPLIYTIDLAKPNQTYSFRLMNFGKASIPMAVSVINWTMDAKGNVLPAPLTEQSLAPWLQINPTTFTLPADGSQVVRFAIRPAVPLSPGEHRAMIYFSEQPQGKQPKGTFRVLFRLGAAVYARVPPYTMLGEILSAKPDAHGVTFEVRNTGNATARMIGTYVVWKKGAVPVGGPWPAQLGQPTFKPPIGLAAGGALPPYADLPGLTRSVRLEFEDKKGLAPGAYELFMRGTFGTPSITRELSFAVSSATH
ncbi:conserved hypothetical protein, secreted [mine drainage metagenome]|uniref:Pili assembly chaperone N-terminal domain-containing protein n=1 Tax=mine drainage metagenome TaxID=410659 RepID=T1AVX3_9ZZZZ